MLTKPDFAHKHVIFAFISHGEKLSFKNDNLVLKDRDGEIRLQTSCYQVFALFLVGHFSVTSGLLQRAQRFGFSIYHLSHNLKFVNAITTMVEGNFLLREKQYAYQGYEIAQKLVSNKIANQLGLLKKIRKKSDNLKSDIGKLDGYLFSMREADQLETFLGLEGSASRLFFKHQFSNCNWSARKPRVKHDPMNTLLDIGYSLLFNVVESLLNLYGFDVYRGVYHTNFYQRKSLVCDLVEPFRSIIDEQLKSAHGLGQVKTPDFTYRKGQYFLNYQEAKPYVRFFLDAIMAHKLPMFDYVQSYYRSFMRNRPIEQYPYYDHGKKQCC